MCSTTGGLVDTVKEGITGFHMGRFSANVRILLFSSDLLLMHRAPFDQAPVPNVSSQCNVVDKEDIEKVVKTVKRAINVYRTPAFAQMIQNCMKQDLSWKVSDDNDEVIPFL